MSRFQKQSYKKKIMYSPITLVVLAIVFIIVSYGVIGIIPKYRDAVRQKDAVLKKQAVFEERQNHLNQELNKLKTPEGFEQDIREKLNVVKDGEQVIIVVDKPIKASEQTTMSVPKETWWSKFINRF
jgi:cell division protein FtsB